MYSKRRNCISKFLNNILQLTLLNSKKKIINKYTYKCNFNKVTTLFET